MYPGQHAETAKFRYRSGSAMPRAGRVPVLGVLLLALCHIADGQIIRDGALTELGTFCDTTPSVRENVQRRKKASFFTAAPHTARMSMTS